MLEKEIERKLVEGIRRMNGRAYKWTSPGNVGVPDRIVMLPGGRIYFIELKTETGRTSPMQNVQIKRIQDLKFDVRVLHGLAEVDEFLEEVRKEVISHGV